MVLTQRVMINQRRKGRGTAVQHLCQHAKKEKDIDRIRTNLENLEKYLLLAIVAENLEKCLFLALFKVVKRL